MKSFRIEDHSAVALLQRLRDGLMMTSGRQRRVVFNGLRDAMKGLGLVKAKEPIKGIYEGIDSAGGHWFMCEMGGDESTSRLASPGVWPATQTGVPVAGSFADKIYKAALELSLTMGSPALEGKVDEPVELPIIKEAIRRLKEQTPIPLAEPGGRGDNSLLQELLNDALKRMDRARGILTDGLPTPNNNWGMLDTKDIKEKLNEKVHDMPRAEPI